MNNSALKKQAEAWLAAGEPCALVTILVTRGSTPRLAGTRMLVNAASARGTIGGGHLELIAIREARALLQGKAQAGDRHYALGPSLGQCCGGALDLRIEPLQAQHLLEWPQDPLRFELALFGAGHVGRAIVQALAPLPCRLWWIDEREQEFPEPASIPPNCEVVCVDAISAEIRQLPPACRLIICTHSHDLDLELCATALRRTDLPFVGLIGSATKRARFIHRLREQGFDDEAISRLHCPIGLPGIAGKEPEIIAASVAAQMLSLPHR